MTKNKLILVLYRHIKFTTATNADRDLTSTTLTVLSTPMKQLLLPLSQLVLVQTL